MELKKIPKRLFSQNKILAYTSSFFLIFFLLIKLSFIEIFYETLEAIFTFLPMLLILTTATLTYLKTQKEPNPERKKHIEHYFLFLTLKLISLLLIFYFLYSPRSFLPTFLSIIHLIKIFFTLEGFFYFLSQLSLAVVSGSLLYYFYQVYKQSKNPLSSPLSSLKKKLLYSNYFFFLFLLLLSFFTFPQAYAPLTNTLGDLFFSVSNGTVQVFKDNNDFKRFTSVKDFAHQLATSLVQTKDNLKNDIQTNTQTIQVQLDQAQTNLAQSITQTTQSLQNELETDISDKLSITGGTIEGKLTVEKQLTIQNIAITQTIQPEKDGTYDLGSADQGWNKIYVSHLIGSSPITIGLNASNHSLNDDNDLIISGDLEVQNTTYLNNLNLSGTFTKTDTTLVTNLNADLLDGYDSLHFLPQTNVQGTPNYLAKFTATNQLGNSVIYESNGNVGIGTAGPRAKLEVVFSSNTDWPINVYNNGGSAKGIRISGGNSGSDAELLKVMRFDETQTFFTVTDGNSYFPTGNVGIGTTSPALQLEVRGGASGGGFGLYRFNATSNNGGYILVGRSKSDTVGTMSYLASSDEVGKVLAQAVNSTNFKTVGGVYWFADQAHELDKLGTRMEFRVTPNDTNTATTALTVKNTGNVGIGTTSPTQKLHVEGHCITGDSELSAVSREDMEKQSGVFDVQSSKFKVKSRLKMFNRATMLNP